MIMIMTDDNSNSNSNNYYPLSLTNYDRNTRIPHGCLNSQFVIIHRFLTRERKPLQRCVKQELNSMVSFHIYTRRGSYRRSHPLDLDARGLANKCAGSEKHMLPECQLVHSEAHVSFHSLCATCTVCSYTKSEKEPRTYHGRI